jgi:hypothetical protein
VGEDVDFMALVGCYSANKLGRALLPRLLVLEQPSSAVFKSAVSNRTPEMPSRSYLSDIVLAFFRLAFAPLFPPTELSFLIPYSENIQPIYTAGGIFNF